MFYLKYRPHTIQSLDNSAVKEMLSALVSQKEVPHALLFVGQKGTGKTSTARIVAKAVNCLNNRFSGKGNSSEPCNACANCMAIDSGSSPDVVEMDAASNRGIDQIRQITHEASFAPIAGRYRAYIIDEAHMITAEGFNALLKTLEEPPETILFILATTNEEKIPKTIISRCIRINFGTAKNADIASMIKRIAREEHVTVSDELIKLITTNADHSFRDATKILEELVIQNKLDLEKAQTYLGMRTRNNLLEILSHKPLSDALAWSEHYFAQGGSAKTILTETLSQLHDILLEQHHVITPEHTAIHLKPKQVVALMKLFTEAYQLSRISPVESLPLEIAIVEFYNQKL